MKPMPSPGAGVEDRYGNSYPHPCLSRFFSFMFNGVYSGVGNRECDAYVYTSLVPDCGSTVGQDWDRKALYQNPPTLLPVWLWFYQLFT